ncbi:MAG: carboxypeptidase-like regulatory domain-containing protein [Gemmatimonadales bacterium]
MHRIAIPFTLLTLLGCSAAQAQVIRGRLSSELEGSSAGAIVILVDQAGVEQGRTLSAANGRYGFVAPAAGTYRLKVLRIGYPMWVSDTASVGATEVREFSPQLPSMRVVLAPMEVHAQSRCSVHPKEGELTAQLLEEGHKAVSAAEAAYQGNDYRYRVRRYRRDFDRERVLVLDTTYAETENDIWPVQSLPVADLARGGFIQETDPLGGPIWYGPDAQVIFSDFFLGDHCFAVGKPEPQDSGLVRLEFRVVKGQQLPDLNGTLWINSKTLELDHLDFTYSRVPDWVPRDAVIGGRLDFLRLPTGLWIIRRWALRVPVPSRQIGTGYYSILGYREEGGEVVQVVGRGGEVVWGD